MTRRVALLVAAVAVACGRYAPPATVCGGSAFAWSNDTSRTAADPALQALHPTLDIPEAGTESQRWLGGPPDLVELSDGRIVGADLDAGELLVFDSTGARVATWGRRGSGPGEFRDLEVIGPAGGDSTWAFDLRALRLTILDPAGRIARSAVLEYEGAGGWSMVLGRLGDGRFVVIDGALPSPGRVIHAAGSVGPDSSVVRLWRIGAPTSEPLGWFKTFEVYVSRNGMRDLTGLAPFANVATFLATDSGLYYGYPSDLEIRFRSLAGGARRVLATAAEGGPVSASDVARYKAEALRVRSPDFSPRLERVFTWLPFPARYPDFGTFAVDGRGRVWVQEYVPRWAAAARWSLFAPDGRRLGALCAPASFRIAVVRDSALLGTMTDDDGLVHAMVVRLP